MTRTFQWAVGLPIVAALVLSGCRFNPEAAQRVLERNMTAVPTAEPVATAVADALATPVAGVAAPEAPLSGGEAVGGDVSGLVAARCIVSSTEEISVYGMPDANSLVVTALAAREVFTASGRTGDGGWIVAETVTGLFGWTQATNSRCSTPLADLLVVDPGALAVTPVAVAVAATPTAEPAVAVTETVAVVTDTAEITLTADSAVTVTGSVAVITDTADVTLTAGAAAAAALTDTTYLPSVGTANPLVTGTVAVTASGAMTIAESDPMVKVITDSADMLITSTATLTDVTVGAVPTESLTLPAQAAPAVAPRRVLNAISCTVNATDGLNVRTAANVNAPRVMVLRHRQTVLATLRSRDNRWVYLNSRSARGWVAAEFLRCRASVRQLRVTR
jgi:hypothetical protein